MSHEPDGSGEVERRASERLVLVRVDDAVEPKLTARTGASYVSPPQPREHAMTLVRMLLGCSATPGDGQTWTAPIAGGRRVVTLTEETNR